MGEEGYSLTTFQTALAFLETLDVQEKTDESENVQNSDQNPPDNETKERLWNEQKANYHLRTY